MGPAIPTPNFCAVEPESLLPPSPSPSTSPADGAAPTQGTTAAASPGSGDGRRQAPQTPNHVGLAAAKARQAMAQDAQPIAHRNSSK